MISERTLTLWLPKVYLLWYIRVCAGRSKPFVKNTEKTPRREINLALSRATSVH